MSKQCPKCGWIEDDSSQFCSSCGTNLGAPQWQQPQYPQSQYPSQQYPKSNYQQSDTAWSSSYTGGRPPKKKKKTALIVSIVVALVLVLGVGGFFLWQNLQKPDYDEIIAQAQTALDLEEFQKAREKFKEARDLQPDQSEPYEGLYTVYVKTGEFDQADLVVADALEQLSGDEQSSFEYTVEQVDMENNVLTVDGQKQQYSVIKDLGNLDKTPFSLEGDAWLIKQNGLYSFIDKDGTQLNKDNLSKASVEVAERQTKPGRKVFACISDTMPLADPKNQWPYNNTNQCWVSMVGGAGFGRYYRLDGNGKPELYTPEGYEIYHSDDTPVNPENRPIIIQEHDGGGWLNEKYWIYNPALEELYGPYELDTPASYNIGPYIEGNVSFREFSPKGIDNAVVPGPFWVSTDDGLSVYSKDGTVRKDGFDTVQLTDISSIAAKKDGKLTVFDEHLNEQFSGPFEKAGQMIEGRAPVLIDGTWKLIEFK